MTDLKTVLVDAFTKAVIAADGDPTSVSYLDNLGLIGTFAEYGEGEWLDATVLASTVRDHFATLLINVHGEAIRHAFMEALLADKLVTVNDRGRMFQGERELKTDQIVHVFMDRLIEGLAAGGSEG